MADDDKKKIREAPIPKNYVPPPPKGTEGSLVTAMAGALPGALVPQGMPNTMPAQTPMAPAGMQAALGSLNAAPAMTQQGAPAPTAGVTAVTPTNLGIGGALTSPTLSPEALQAQQGRLDSLKSVMDQRKSDWDNVGSKLWGNPTIHQSPFEQQLGQALQKKMVDLLSGHETRGERFMRGYEMGQKFAADVVAPLFGTFNKSPGGALGAYNATNDLQAQVAQAQAHRAQEKQSRNAMLLNLASLYENISPESSKNLTELFKRQMETHKQNLEMEKDAREAYSKSAKDYADAGKDFLNLTSGANKADAGNQGKVLELAQKEGQFANTKANTESEIAARKANSEHQKYEEGQKDKALVLQGRSVAAAEKNADTNATKEGDAKDTKAMADRAAALKELDAKYSQLRRDKSAVNTLGQPRYKNIGENLKANPAELEVLRELHKRAGIKVSPEEAIDQLIGSNAQQSAGGGGFNIGSFLSGLGGQAGNIMGGGAAASAGAAVGNAAAGKQATPAKMSPVEKAREEAKRRGLQI